MAFSNYQAFAHDMNAGHTIGNEANVSGERIQQVKRPLIQSMLRSLKVSPYLHNPQTILYNIVPIPTTADRQINSDEVVCDQCHSPSPSIELDLDFDLSDLLRSPSPSVVRKDAIYVQLSSDACLKGQPGNFEGEIISSDEINNNDIICRQGITNTQSGNVTFKSLITRYQHAYEKTDSTVDKESIAQRIIDEIRKQGGRFLKKCAYQMSNGESTIWVDIGNKAAMEKTRHALKSLKASLYDESQIFNRNNRNDGSIETSDMPVTSVCMPSLTRIAAFDGIEVNDSDVLLCRERDGHTHSHGKWMCL